MRTPTRPVMRYHGGKWKLAPWIISHFPAHKVYVEPYGGAASVLMRKPRSYAEVYNDLSGEVVNVFRVLRDAVMSRELERQLRLTPFARAEFESAYLAAADPIDQARRTLVRSFMGFGSDSVNTITGFRSDSNRSGTTPAHDWMRYPDQIATYCRRLAGVVIESRPAVEVIGRFDGDQTLFYADPPYPMSTREGVARYEYEMIDEQHRDLAAALHDARGMVVLSGYPCAMYDELYPDWQRIEQDAFADGARPRTEALWLSPRTQAQLLPLFAIQRARVIADAQMFATVQGE
jgi:DNA adenine methylase